PPGDRARRPGQCARRGRSGAGPRPTWPRRGRGWTAGTAWNRSGGAGRFPAAPSSARREPGFLIRINRTAGSYNAGMENTLALIREYYAAFSRGDRESMLALLADDAAHDLNQGVRETGREAFRAFMQR